jgi:hypothetical protein
MEDKKMRNRIIKKQYWLNENEDNLLKEKCSKAGLSESDFIRAYIQGYKVKEKPDENFYYILRDLRGMAINMNQLARQANSYKYVDSDKFFAIANRVFGILTDIQEMYLLPEKKGA